MKIRTSIQYWIDKLDEDFSLARYGDGELLCMWGKSGGNSNGCQYLPELREGLLKSISVPMHHGLQRVLPQDERRALSEYPIEWYDTEVFGEAAANGEIWQFIRELRKKPITIIGNYSIRDATRKLFPDSWFIEVPPVNAIKSKDEVVEKILWEERFGSRTRLFSCGMAANVMISELHGKGQLIDVGHIWDPFAGSMSRCDLKDQNVWLGQ